MKMMLQLKVAIKGILGLRPPNRKVTVRPSDIFLVSYPRSGNTWLRFLLANLFGSDEPISFANIEQKIPDIYQNPDKVMCRLPIPRVLKSHEYFDARYPKVIYLVRDPRDVVLSYYAYHQKNGWLLPNEQLTAFGERFVTDGLYDVFGSWGHHVGSWLQADLGSEQFLLCRYEDLMERPLSELQKISAFLRQDWSESVMIGAMDESSLYRMRHLEQKQASNWATTRKTQQDIPFIGSGEVGGWQQKLPSQSVALIESTWPQLMQKLGYLV